MKPPVYKQTTGAKSGEGFSHKHGARYPSIPVAPSVLPASRTLCSVSVTEVTTWTAQPTPWKQEALVPDRSRHGSRVMAPPPGVTLHRDPLLVSEIELPTHYTAFLRSTAPVAAATLMGAGIQATFRVL